MSFFDLKRYLPDSFDIHKHKKTRAGGAPNAGGIAPRVMKPPGASTNRDGRESG